MAALPTTSDALLSSTVSTILGFKSTAATDTANATAATTQATGYAAEGTAYGTAEDIAAQNAVIAGVAGNIKTLQEQRIMRETEGSQRAAIAASGFGASGSSLDILRSSLQQGYLNQQLTATQTALTQGGYLEEAAASAAQKAGTAITGQAASDLAASYTASSSLAKANAANATAALNNFIGTSTLTSDQELILAPLTQDATVATTGTVSSTNPMDADIAAAKAASLKDPWATTTTPATTSVNPGIFSFKP